MPDAQTDSSLTDFTSRYSRQVTLPQVGHEGQRKLLQSKALVVGLGGLGSPVALYLAAAGVGTLGLAEFDKVEEHNLQRQTLYQDKDVNASKVEVACERLQALSPGITLHKYEKGVQAENVVQCLEAYDLVIDCSDNFPTRYLLNDAAFFLGKPIVHGSVFQFEGQVSLFHSQKEGPCYRCLFPEMPASGSIPSCEQAGVFGALCGVVGSTQAIEAIKYILGIGESLLGRLLVINALDMRIRSIKIKKDNDCSLCGTRPRIKTIKQVIEPSVCPPPSSKTTLGKARKREPVPLEIDVAEARQWLGSKQTIYLLDVREPFEVDICKIEGSVNIPMGMLMEKYSALPERKSILIYCHHGGRSLRAAQFLRAKGFSKVTHIIGGIEEWAKRNEPSMARY